MEQLPRHTQTERPGNAQAQPTGEGDSPARRVPWSLLAILGLGSTALVLAALTIGMGVLEASEAVPDGLVPDPAVEVLPAVVEALPEPLVEPIAEALPAAEPPTQTGTPVDVGIASTYGVGDDFQGRQTACGQTFDTNFPQAAHKMLPCGTLIRVESEETGRSVIVEVTDRGPFTPGRVVDLSMAAYRQLDPSGEPGLQKVRVYRLPAP